MNIHRRTAGIRKHTSGYLYFSPASCQPYEVCIACCSSSAALRRLKVYICKSKILRMLPHDTCSMHKMYVQIFQYNILAFPQKHPRMVSYCPAHLITVPRFNCRGLSPVAVIELKPAVSQLSDTHHIIKQTVGVLCYPPFCCIIYLPIGRYTALFRPVRLSCIWTYITLPGNALSLLYFIIITLGNMDSNRIP